MRNLRTEQEIKANWQGDPTQPVVSVCCITYNHEKYIEDTLEGFFIQKTNFPFEIMIHDDASTDRTADIIREYEIRYPNLIKPIYQTVNQYSQGNKPGLINRKRAKGKYIALCEGDDYWTDPDKLQKQFDFLEKNLDCSLCFHAAENVYENNPQKNSFHRPKKIPGDSKFGMKHAILGGGGFMATNSMLFLKEHIDDIPDWVKQAPVGDGPLVLLLASKGKLGYIDEIMSVYRRMTPNSWSSSMQSRINKKKWYREVLNMWNDFDEWSNYKYHYTVVIKKNKNKWYYFKRLTRDLLGGIIN